jgi:hypothetical protein
MRRFLLSITPHFLYTQIQMRIPLLLLCTARLIAAQTAILDGTVIDAITRQPLPGTHIAMFSLTTEGGQPFPGNAFGAVSQADGHFSIANLPDATFFVYPQRTGYVAVPGKDADAWAGTSLVLKPGESRTNLTIEMAPRAAILGRVTDEFGDPIQGASVEGVANGPAYERFPMGTNMSANTDDRGQFRLSGAPGKYRIKVTPRLANVNGPPEIRSDGTRPALYGPTWYPSVDSKDHATVVNALPGRDLAGIDIRLVSGHTLSLSGVVTGMPPNAPSARVLLWKEGDYMQNSQRSVAKDGRFTVSGLTAGTFRLRAIQDGYAPMQSAVVEVRLQGADETNVSLRLVAGERLSGTLELEGDPEKRFTSEKRTLRLEPASQSDQMFASTPSTEVAADGTFQITPVYPGRFRIAIAPLPENAFVKTVRVDDTAVPDGLLDFTRGVPAAHLRVLVSPNGAQLTGKVVDALGNPPKAPLILLFLAQTADDIGGGHMQRVAAGASFSFQGIRPGKYRLLAIDPLILEDGVHFETLKPFFPRGTEIEIKEGEKTETNTRIIVQDAPDGK